MDAETGADIRPASVLVGAGPAMHELPASTVRLLTSSQVITSVVSVVKELVENSLDAGATSIDIKLEDFGLEKVEVRDNGCGIKTDDTSYMARPHYTSKIANIQDLESLTTYGFRGEALGSLCSVSDVTITTKTAEDKISMVYTIDRFGQVTNTKPSHWGQGTTVVAQNLFRNLPVRRQYYNTTKKKKESLKKVEDVVIAFGVVNHGVRFVLRHGKDLVWQKAAVAEARSALLGVLGTGVVNQMEHLKKSSLELDVEIEAFLPKRSAAVHATSRATNDRCFVFVNKRPVYLKEVEKLLRQHYCSGLGCESSRYPLCFLHIVAAADSVDVNLDPNKTKVLLHSWAAVLEYLQGICEDVYGPLQGSATEARSTETCSREDASDHATDDHEVLDVETNSTLQQRNTSCQSLSCCERQHSETVIGTSGKKSPVRLLSGPRESDEELAGFKLMFYEEELSEQGGIHREKHKSSAMDSCDPLSPRNHMELACSEDLQVEVSDSEMLQYFPDRLTAAETVSAVGVGEAGDVETLSSKPVSENETQPAVLLTQGLTFDLCLGSDDGLLPVNNTNPVDISSTLDNEHGVPGTLTSIDESCILAGSAPRPRESSESRISSSLHLPQTTSAGGSCDLESVLGHSGDVTSVPEKGLTDAVPDITDLTDNNNARQPNATVDWSKGVSVEGSNGSSAQPVTLLQSNSSHLRPMTSVCNPFESRKTNDLAPTQPTLHDLVGNSTVKRPTAGYMYFSRDVRPGVVAQLPRAGFQEISKIVGQKWQGLSEVEKTRYENMAQDMQRQRQQQRKESLASLSGSAASRKLQAKRRKINQWNKANPGGSGLTSSTSSESKTTAQVKVVTAKFSLLGLKQQFEFGLKPTQQWSNPDDHIKPVGQLKSHPVWLCCCGNQLVIIQPIRTQEELIVNKLLSNHSLQLQTLDEPIPLDSDHRRPGLTHEELRVLSGMEKTVGPFPDIYTHYTDPRLLSNGFEVREHRDPSAQGPRPEIVRMSACINFFGLQDLREILQHVACNKDVNLKGCRPNRVKHYLQGEAVRMARQLPQRATKEDLLDIMYRAKCQLDEAKTSCFHNRPFVIPVYDLHALPCSQSSQTSE